MLNIETAGKNRQKPQSLRNQIQPAKTEKREERRRWRKTTPRRTIPPAVASRVVKARKKVIQPLCEDLTKEEGCEYHLHRAASPRGE